MSFTTHTVKGFSLFSLWKERNRHTRTTTERNTATQQSRRRYGESLSPCAGGGACVPHTQAGISDSNSPTVLQGSRKLVGAC